MINEGPPRSVCHRQYLGFSGTQFSPLISPLFRPSKSLDGKRSTIQWEYEDGRTMRRDVLSSGLGRSSAACPCDVPDSSPTHSSLDGGLEATELTLPLTSRSGSLSSMDGGLEAPEPTSPPTSKRSSSMDGCLEAVMPTSPLTSKSQTKINPTYAYFPHVTIVLSPPDSSLTLSKSTHMRHVTGSSSHLDDSLLTLLSDYYYFSNIPIHLDSLTQKSARLSKRHVSTQVEQISRARYGRLFIAAGSGIRISWISQVGSNLSTGEQVSGKCINRFRDRIWNFVQSTPDYWNEEEKKVKTQTQEINVFIIADTPNSPDMSDKCSDNSRTNVRNPDRDVIQQHDHIQPPDDLNHDKESGSHSQDANSVNFRRGISGSPPNHRSFQCSVPKEANKKTEGVPHQGDLTIGGKSDDPGDDRDDRAPESESSATVRTNIRLKEKPTADFTPIKWSYERSGLDVTSEPPTVHVCTSKLASDQSSASRHDHNDSFPSNETSHYEVDPGTILDLENEGDAELLSKKISGTSNITSDLDQLKPGQTPDSSPSVQHINTNASIKIDPSDPKDRTHPETIGNSKVADRVTDSPEDNLNNRDATSDDAMDSQHKAWDQCVKHCQRTKNNSDTSSDSYDTHCTSYSGGMAGLDPDHSAEWVPSSINVSKSKKRRRRTKKQLDQRRKQDSLGKLLSGKQTKEDEEQISTFDIGNANRGKKVKLQSDPHLRGNLHTSGQGLVQDCEGQSSFAATFNSTKHGPDFEDDLESLRGDSGKEEVDMHCDDSIPKPTEHEEDIADDNPEEGERSKEDSLSGNSTGTKRKRKRNKKATKQPKPDQPAAPAAPDQGGIATRSKTQPKITEIMNTKNDKQVPDITKGEKEKNSAPPSSTSNSFPMVAVTDREVVPTQTATTQPQQSNVFKQPKAMTRTDIQRIVSKAVQKSKSRVSNNFAFNSKIQKFKITTDSANVPKFPDIDLSKPFREVAIPEFIWPDERKTMDGLVDIKSKGVIQFVVLARSGHVAHEAWDAPKLDMVRDFASFLLCKIAELKLEFGTILRWTNPWGSVAVVGLDSSDLDMLQRFRTFFTTLRFNHHYFNTFPKDALTNSLSLHILLKNDLREFKEEFLAEALFARNKLYGILETLEAETYTAADTTRAGVSKNGWRNVLLEGDEYFLRSLSAFPALHWFNLGPATVQIHGGERRAETEEEIEAKNKRKRFNMPVGQNLSSAAKASINQSFQADQQMLLLKKRNAKSGVNAPVPAQQPTSEGFKSQNKKKK